ncbi:DUF1059 domain-containing protein [Haloarcula rubra]|nr:DUF1059 domain-containing protein [Halomicroarcula rubra]
MCDAPNCDFEVRSDTEEELVSVVQQHAEQHHDATLSREDAMGMVREI